MGNTKPVCGRCGGSGNYANFGVCFRCGGSGRANAVPVRSYAPRERPQGVGATVIVTKDGCVTMADRKAHDAPGYYGWRTAYLPELR